jgi:hypothetical protein
VYIRFGFGTSAGATTPRLQVTTGTSTNGSGVLGGTALSVVTNININSGGTQAQTTDTARNSYLCCQPGFLGLSWKTGTSNCEGFFFFNRHCDSTGAIDATGAHGWWGQGNNTGVNRSQAFRFAATAAAYTAQNTPSTAYLGFNPQNLVSTLVGSDIQVALGWSVQPRVTPLFGVCGVLDAEVTAGTTFSVALVGSSARTYIALATTAGPFSNAAVGAGYCKFAMLWE